MTLVFRGTTRDGRAGHGWRAAPLWLRRLCRATARWKLARTLPLIFFLGCPGPTQQLDQPVSSGADASRPSRTHLRASDLPVVEDVEGLKVVTLRGTPEERGRAVGTLFGNEIRTRTIPYTRNVIARIIGGKAKAQTYVQFVASRVPASALAELRALATAARVSLEDILLFNTFLEPLTQACSSALVVGARSKGGQVQLGRNTDIPMPVSLQPPVFTGIVHPTKGASYAGHFWPGMILPTTAINVHGVAVVIHGGSTQSKGRDCIPIGFSVLAALGQTETATAFADRLQGGHHCAGVIIVVADPSSGLIMEVSGPSFGRVLPQEGLLTATNHYQSKELATPQRESCESTRRQAILHQALTSPDAAAIDRRLLQQSLMLDGVFKPSPENVFSVNTVLSAVAVPATRGLYLWERGTPRGTFRGINLAKRLSARD